MFAPLPRLHPAVSEPDDKQSHHDLLCWNTPFFRFKMRFISVPTAFAYDNVSEHSLKTDWVGTSWACVI